MWDNARIGRAYSSFYVLGEGSFLGVVFSLGRRLVSQDRERESVCVCVRERVSNSVNHYDH